MEGRIFDEIADAAPCLPAHGSDLVQIRKSVMHNRKDNCRRATSNTAMEGGLALIRSRDKSCVETGKRERYRCNRLTDLVVRK